MKSFIFISLFITNIAFANFYGKDDRVRVAFNDPIRNLIGKIIFANGSGCTGSMISHDLILTAAHCLYDSNKLKKGAIYFELGKVGFAQHIHRTLVSNYYLPESANAFGFNNNEDFAVLRLRDKVDARIRPFKMVALTRRSLKRQPVKIAGYGVLSGTETLTKTLDYCNIKSYPLFTTTVSHNCDMSSGDSGAPLYNCDRNGCTIYALNVSEVRKEGATSSLRLGEWSSSHPNYAIGVYKFQRFVNSVLNE